MLLSNIFKILGEYGYYLVWIICLFILFTRDLTRAQQLAVLLYAILPINWAIFYVLSVFASMGERAIMSD